MSICPENERRATLSDGEFWDEVLLGDNLPPRRIGSDWDPVDLDDDGISDVEVTYGEPCPECGEYGACAYDEQGRPLMHIPDERNIDGR